MPPPQVDPLKRPHFVHEATGPGVWTRALRQHLGLRQGGSTFQDAGDEKVEGQAVRPCITLDQAWLPVQSTS
jgi:hypothetical protein